MTVETRPALDGIPDDQRTLALAHWWLWRASQESEGLILRPDLSEVPEARVLRILENGMQPLTLHRLAQARARYWREIRP